MYKILLLSFLVLSTSNVRAEYCTKHHGVLFCTDEDHKLNPEFLSKVKSYDISTGQINEEWNSLLHSVGKYLHNNGISVINTAGGFIRKMNTGVRIDEKKKEHSFELTGTHNKGRKDNIVNGAWQLIENPELLGIYKILTRADQLAKGIFNITFNKERRLIKFKNNKTKSDSLGNIYLGNDISHLNKAEIYYVMLHEALHILPIRYEDNVFLRKYIYLNVSKKYNKGSLGEKTVINLLNNKDIAVSYDKLILADSNYEALYDREVFVDFMVANYLLRKNQPCSDYVKLLKKVRVDIGRLNFANEYCVKASALGKEKIGLIELFHDVHTDRVINIILLNKSAYSKTSSIEKIFKSLKKNTKGVEESLALDVVYQSFSRNKGLSEYRSFVYNTGIKKNE